MTNSLEKKIDNIIFKGESYKLTERQVEILNLKKRFFNIKNYSLEKNKHPVISVIVPIFNCEKYLEKCINSILEQTFTDFEILCVEDCSTDSSLSLIEAIQKKDSRIRLIKHRQNKGLGGARNTGLVAAKGEFIASVDSDDYIEKNMLEELYNTAIDNNVSIVACGYKCVNTKGETISIKKYNRKIINSNSPDFDIFNTFNPAFWNKLWKKSLYIENNIFFPEFVFYQDLATTPRILAYTDSIFFNDKCLYNYLQRDDSATFSTTPKHIVDYYKVFNILKNFLIKENLFEKYSTSYFNAIKRALKFRCNNIVNSNLNYEEKKLYLEIILSLRDFYLIDNTKYVNINDISDIHNYIDNDYSKKIKTIDLSIIVKTINRHTSLFNFLNSCGKYQEYYKIIFKEILIGDDSDDEFKKKNKFIISEVIKKYPNLNIKHFNFDYDIGASLGRNKLVEKATADFIMTCDDDFILDVECDYVQNINKFNKDIDIIGGWLKNKYDMITGEYEYRSCYGYFSQKNNIINLEIDEDKYKTPEFKKCDFIMQFFIARRNILLKFKWDNELKTEEHYNFFYNLFTNNVNIYFAKSLFAKHDSNKKKNTDEYNLLRFKKERRNNYLFKSIKKCNAQKMIITTKKFNKKHIWTIDTLNKTSKEVTELL